MQTDREQDGLKGAVRSVRMRVAKLPARMPRPATSANTLRQFVAYDRQGRMTEEVTYTEDDTTIARRVVFDRDEDGSLRETRMYDEAGALFHRSVRAHDADGKRVEELSYEADGKLSERALRLYDGEGRMLEWAIYALDGRLQMKFVMRYDERGRETETLFCHGGAAGSIVRFEQSEDGGVTAHHVSEAEMIPAPECGEGAYAAGSTRYSYSEAGEVVETTQHNPAGALISRHVYTEDDDGSRSERAEYDAAGRLTSRETYERETDEHGNWTRETVASWVARFSSDGSGEPEPVEEHRREITYY